MTATIERSKRLAECADWLIRHAEFEASIETELNLRLWAADLYRIIIPEPVKEDES